MIFTKKKLPLEKVADLISYPLSATEDYKILGSPVYLSLRKNEKLVSVKEPLDFFTPGEREKLSAVSADLFVTKIFREAKYLEQAGGEVRQTLSWLKEGAEGRLEPAIYEVSQALREKLNTVWSKFSRGDGVLSGIESFFIPFFVDGACEGLDRTYLVAARTENFARYELAMLQSSLVVFFLMHLSYLEPATLAAIRNETFRCVFEAREMSGVWPIEVKSVHEWVTRRFPDTQSRLITAVDAADEKGATLQKIHSRIARFTEARLAEPRSVRGREGFIEPARLIGVAGSVAVNEISQEFLTEKKSGGADAA